MLYIIRRRADRGPRLDGAQRRVVDGANRGGTSWCATRRRRGGEGRKVCAVASTVWIHHDKSHGSLTKGDDVGN
jgi:hypothetical protein